jgi:hypothetical protein
VHDAAHELHLRAAEALADHAALDAELADHATNARGARS